MSTTNEHLNRIERWARLQRGFCSDVRESLTALREQIAEMERRIEQTDAQHAGCMTAALGWSVGDHAAKRGDYGWSQAYQDVLELRRAYESAKEQIAALTVERDQALAELAKETRCHVATINAAADALGEDAERIATLEAENLALRSEEWLCVLCRANFGERRAALSPVDTPQTAQPPSVTIAEFGIIHHCAETVNPAPPSPSVESAANRELGAVETTYEGPRFEREVLRAAAERAGDSIALNAACPNLNRGLSAALPNPPTPKDEEKASTGLPDLEAEECECCGRPATTKDVDAVPLCDGCYEDLKRETNALASPSEEPK